MRLWLQRHAALLDSEHSGNGCYGATDLPADPCLTQQAAQAIAAQLPADVVIVTSPLQRCTSLADAIVGLRNGPPAHRDARLAEMDFGDWEGRPWEDIGRPALDAWTADFADHRPGGGESVRVFMQRVEEAWTAWRTRGQPTLWVTHAGVIRAAMLLQAGVACPTRSDQWPAQALPFGGWWTLEGKSGAPIQGAGVFGR